MKRIVVMLSAVLPLMPGQVWAGPLFDQARATYTMQFNSYRETYGEFLLKRSEFNNNSSFANQEAMVIAARAMLIQRARVWNGYWQALRTDVSENPGLDPELRAKMNDRIQVEQDLLATYEGELEKILEREPLLIKAEELNERDKDYRNLAYEVLMENKLADFDWAVKELSKFGTNIGQAVDVQIRDAAEKQLRLRGLQEVNSILVRLGEIHEETTIKVRKEKQNKQYEREYEAAAEALTGPYSDMIRATDLLRELAKGLEL